jgi:hypothetical protein
MRAGIQANRTFGQRHRADVSHSIERSIIDFFTAYNDSYQQRDSTIKVISNKSSEEPL